MRSWKARHSWFASCTTSITSAESQCTISGDSIGRRYGESAPPRQTTRRCRRKTILLRALGCVGNRRSTESATCATRLKRGCSSTRTRVKPLHVLAMAAIESATRSALSPSSSAGGGGTRSVDSMCVRCGAMSTSRNAACCSMGTDESPTRQPIVSKSCSESLSHSPVDAGSAWRRPRAVVTMLSANALAPAPSALVSRSRK